MASEREIASDSDEGYVTKVSDEDLRYLKKKIASYIVESKDLSAEFHHHPGQPAQLVLTCDSKKTKARKQAYNPKQSTMLLVKNLPDTIDEEHLEMFFEHRKRQGGGPVKNVTLHQDDGFAVIEFQEVEAVDTVLKKRPIKILGKPVEVEMYMPYFHKDESLKSINVVGIPDELVEDMAEMALQSMKRRRYAPKLCQIKKSADLANWGFTLQAESGHYFIYIVEGSPAQDAGLKVGDRIIEINGVNILDDTQDEVVSRIKASNNVMDLLVADDETYRYYYEQGITVTSSMPEVICLASRPKP